MSRSRSESSKKIRLCACTIIVEVPADLPPAQQEAMLEVIDKQNLEGQALEALAWHFRDKRILRQATARLER
jgi:hypothetical protein